jgi:hypothetical protein
MEIFLKDNKVMQYVDHIIDLKQQGDTIAINALIDSKDTEYVTLKDVGFTFIKLMDDFVNYVDDLEELLRVLVQNLPKETQEAIELQLTKLNDDTSDNKTGGNTTNE